MEHTAGGHGAAGNAARVALISGAASGIGLATAERLARSGWTVYAGFRPEGRSAPPREPDPHKHLHWLPLDVTDAGARRAALRDIERAHGHLDALINNAGILASGPLEEVPEGTLRRVMEVNFFGAIQLTRTFLPLMRCTGGGVILMVSSLSGLIGLPFDGAYAASKFALEGASESLRYELEPFGVKVALVEPGAYATALAASVPSANAAGSAYTQFERLRRTCASEVPDGADPGEAARIIEETLLQHAPELRVPCGAQALAVTRRLATLEGAGRRDFALAAAGLSTER
jgi:NAD(P)-dependent dehydrogenase (short-subunit alcohol dehydrogenase family)